MTHGFMDAGGGLGIQEAGKGRFERQQVGHRFAVMALLRWYRSGEDVERRLPFLSAYLGHVHVSDTYWYLSAWPELMQEAMSRLERCWEGQS